MKGHRGGEEGRRGFFPSSCFFLSLFVLFSMFSVSWYFSKGEVVGFATILIGSFTVIQYSTGT